MHTLGVGQKIIFYCLLLFARFRMLLWVGVALGVDGNVAGAVVVGGVIATTAVAVDIRLLTFATPQ